jgi:hypothetical protein
VLQLGMKFPQALPEMIIQFVTLSFLPKFTLQIKTPSLEELLEQF